MGTSITGKPAQIAPDQSMASRPPMQLAPSAKAVVPQTPAPKKWSDVVDAAFAISREQNGGQPRTGRQCQPKLKVCTTAIFFTGKDGKQVMIKATEDMNGKHLSHEICSFNEFMDVRTCVDWGDGSTHRDICRMLAANGKRSRTSDKYANTQATLQWTQASQAK